MRPSQGAPRVAEERTVWKEPEGVRSQFKGAPKRDQLEMPRGLGEGSFPTFIGHCMGNVSPRVVSEPLHAHLLKGNHRWGPGICIISSPGNSCAHGVLRPSCY